MVCGLIVQSQSNTNDYWSFCNEFEFDKKLSHRIEIDLTPNANKIKYKFKPSPKNPISE